MLRYGSMGAGHGLKKRMERERLRLFPLRFERTSYFAEATALYAVRSV